VSYLTHSY